LITCSLRRSLGIDVQGKAWHGVNDGLGDLVRVVGTGNAGASIEELADSGAGGQKPDDAGQERPVGADGPAVSDSVNRV
jgi:hypothetical protein